MSRALLSVGGVTINTDYLLYIEPQYCEENQHRVIAMLTGAREEKMVTLVSKLKTFGHAEYVAECISRDIDSENDTYITSDELAEYLQEYEEREEEKLLESEEDETEMEKINSGENNEAHDFDNIATTNSAVISDPRIKIFGKEYPLSYCVKGLSVMKEVPAFLGTTKHHLTINFGEITLATCKTEEHAEKCKKLFLEDFENGMTEFNSTYFYQLTMR